MSNLNYFHESAVKPLPTNFYTKISSTMNLQSLKNSYIFPKITIISIYPITYVYIPLIPIFSAYRSHDAHANPNPQF